ncbi:putative ATP-dependent RNA helicase [Neospora caninum Liverpool]|uniref:ATP-dependent RNA helicase, putative n=1 Tax=Neospora caninum (strain Liverpool) TaxID=572307 RepID=F0VF91_NEOCL|nr:putative ATP-dependent RNA helicase [Neospora caninum Liverpool]CBZ52385.1 putative ATP-dependent RNA helicase [Neospora caninum Liverpool]CEL66356.1 TPA: ATP-dependent RNA helicase, putative [Neospora caninum Liverpool]|eukprot:XP_003882417.1 putative ATP-dependent RNA helicase [Neospora caninum Liverpool]
MERFFLTKGEEEPEVRRAKLPLLGSLEPVAASPKDAGASAGDDDDPLDAYMNQISEQIQVEDEAIRQRQEREAAEEKAAGGAGRGATSGAEADPTCGRFVDDDDPLADSYAYVLDQRQKEAEAQAANLLKARRKKTRGGDSDDDFGGEDGEVRGTKQLASVDHSMLVYPAFQRDIYTEAADLCSLSHEAVGELRASLQIRITGLNAPRPIASFLHLKESLSKALFAGINKRGFTLPTPIQSAAIPCLMRGRDVLGLAETGSGKTAAYLIPVLARLQHLKEEEKWPKQHVVFADNRPEKVGAALRAGPAALILCPTRELAVQIDGEVHALLAKAKLAHAAVPLKHALLAGGFDKTEQYKALKVGVDLAVANPGRLIDLATMKGLEDVLKKVVMVVIDEADKMVQMGFENQLRSILSALRPDRITCMFSATLPQRCETIGRQFLRSPVKITIGEGGQAAKSVEQNVAIVHSEEGKFHWVAAHLLSLLSSSDPGQEPPSDNGRVAVVFCNTQQRCEDLAFLLEAELSAQMDDLARAALAPSSSASPAPGVERAKRERDECQAGARDEEKDANWGVKRRVTATKELTRNENTKAAAARLLHVELDGEGADVEGKLLRNAEQTFKYVAVVHGGLNQTERLTAVRRLHRHLLKPPPPPVSSLPPSVDAASLISPLVLVATDVAARGLDFPAGLSLVVSYDAPAEGEVYVHRIGRAGRAGRRGRSFALLTRAEKRSAALLVEAMEAVDQQAPRQLLDMAMGYAPFRNARLAGMKMEEPARGRKKKGDHRQSANASFGLGYTGPQSSSAAEGSHAKNVYAAAASAAAAAICLQKEQAMNLREGGVPVSGATGSSAAGTAGAKRGRWDSDEQSKKGEDGGSGPVTLEQLRPASSSLSSFSLNPGEGKVENGGDSRAQQPRVVGVDDELSSDDEPAVPAAPSRPGLLNLSKREERRRQWAEEAEARREQQLQKERDAERRERVSPPRKSFTERRPGAGTSEERRAGTREGQGTGAESSSFSVGSQSVDARSRVQAGFASGHQHPQAAAHHVVNAHARPGDVRSSPASLHSLYAASQPQSGHAGAPSPAYPPQQLSAVWGTTTPASGGDAQRDRAWGQGSLCTSAYSAVPAPNVHASFGAAGASGRVSDPAAAAALAAAIAHAQQAAARRDAGGR